MAMESDDAAAKRAAAGGNWSELKHEHSGMRVPDGSGELVDGPTFAQAPVLYLDAGDVDSSLKADGADLLALKSRRRRRPSEATPTSAPAAGDAGVAFSSFELSYVPPHEALPVGAAHYNPHPYSHGNGHGGGHPAPSMPPPGADPHYQPRLSIPPDNVGAFLQSLTLTFGANLSSLDFLRARLAEMGYDSIYALAFVSDQELAMAGIAFPQDQHAIRTCAHQEFAVRRPPSPPGLYQMVTMSKWLTLCSIPRQMATLYTTHLQRFGYDSVQHFESIGHDSRALSVFRPGHYHLFKYHLERVLQLQQQQQFAANTAQGYGMYYSNGAASAITTSSSRQADDFNSTLLDDLVPSGFPLSPSVHGMRHQPTTSMYLQTTNASSSFYPQAETVLAHPGAASSFTQMMHDDTSAPVPSLGGPPMRRLKEAELRLLYEAVNMDDKANPCRRGKKVEWSVIATNGMGEPRFSVLAQYTAEELEHNYVQNHELPLHTTARNSEWSSELIKLLWKVSQDTRCKNGTKTMWEQIAQGRTGVNEYQPLSKFSNSQLRSRFRTEFGDKRPQSRKKARENKNAAAKVAAMGLAAVAGTQSGEKNAAKQKAVAIKARQDLHNANRMGLSDESIPPGSSGPLAV